MAIQDFPGGTIVKDLIASARDMGLIPDPERFHMPQRNKARVPQLLSPHSRARELQLLKEVYLEPVLRHQRSQSQ